MSGWDIREFGSRGLGWPVFVGGRQSGVCLGGFCFVFPFEICGAWPSLGFRVVCEF